MNVYTETRENEGCDITRTDHHEYHCETHDVTMIAGTSEPVYCPTGYEEIESCSAPSV